MVQRDIEGERALSAKIEDLLRDGESMRGAEDANSLLKSLSEIHTLAKSLYPENKALGSLLDEQAISRAGSGDASIALDEKTIKKYARDLARAIEVRPNGGAVRHDSSNGESDSSLLPSQIAEKMEKLGVQKVGMNPFSVFVLAMMAGAFISLGGIYFTFTTTQTIVTTAFTQILGGLMFSMGLIFVVIIGAEMFTSSTLSIVSLASRKISVAKLVKNWSIVYAGNIVGTLATVGILYMSKAWTTNNYQFAVKALMIASHKTSLGPIEAFFLGILCNCLVCLAVWLAAGGKKISDKVLAIVFPVSAFVALGFEHCVANMYFLSFAYVIKTDPTFLAALQKMGTSIDMSHITLAGMAGNLIPVTLGNIVGGSVLIGLANWLAYLRKDRKQTISRD
ncbi:MAG TPA: formate/nitrite transporter family protein [Candidatus Nitrosotalea sp.]|nr:formate/nitrite transporter family protein [Candidatus Nitrosotalea sp.]